MDFEKLRTGARGVKDATGENMAAEESYAEWGMVWPVYNSGASDYFREGDGFGQVMSVQEAEEAIARLHQHNKHVLGIDIMGQGKACIDIGCDKALAVTLPIPDTYENKDALVAKIREGNVDLIQGDVFSKPTVLEMLARIDDYCKEDGILGSVMYRPVDGGFHYAGNAYAEKYLFERLFLPLYDRLANGGHVLMSLNQFDDTARESLPGLLETHLGPGLYESVWSDDRKQLRIVKPS